MSPNLHRPPPTGPSRPTPHPYRHIRIPHSRRCSYPTAQKNGLSAALSIDHGIDKHLDTIATLGPESASYPETLSSIVNRIYDPSTPIAAVRDYIASGLEVRGAPRYHSQRVLEALDEAYYIKFRGYPVQTMGNDAGRCLSAIETLVAVAERKFGLSLRDEMRFVRVQLVDDSVEEVGFAPSVTRYGPQGAMVESFKRKRGRFVRSVEGAEKRTRVGSPRRIRVGERDVDGGADARTMAI